MDNGRYMVVDLASGRKFVVEPIAERDQRTTDRIITNGGSSGDAVKEKSLVRGGSVHEADSIVTCANGFKNITTAPAGTSPMDVINTLLAQ